MAVEYRNSPIGLLRLTADLCSLCAVERVEQMGQDSPNAVTEKAAEQLDEYFSGQRTSFCVSAHAHGTPFQEAVWQAMSRIPYGKTVTYGALARAIGHPAACRAVAGAVGKNPMLILFPCHRVVAANSLGGFSAGLDAKRMLLKLEGVDISEKTAISEKFFFTFKASYDTI